MISHILWRPIAEAPQTLDYVYLAVPSFPKPVMGNWRENESYCGKKKTGWFSILGCYITPTHYAEIPYLPDEIRKLDTSCPSCPPKQVDRN